MKVKTKTGLLAAFLCVAFTAAVQAQLPNAWQINDNSTASGSYFAYFTNLNSEQFDGATSNGWRFTFTSRLLTDYGGANGSMYFIYGSGTRRYGINLHLNSSGQLIATPLGGSAITLTTAAGAGSRYHNHQLVYDPATGNVTYRFDGTPKATWSGEASTGQAHEAVWGSDSSGDRGEMNFNRVDFEVFGQGAVATYDAGFAGNPAVAPDPQAQGWALDGSTSLVSAGPVSPDSVGITTDFGDTDAGLPALFGGSIAAGDYNNDGRMDLLLTGLTSAETPITQLWRNTGYGFVNSGISLPAVNASAVAWGDYNNDGLLDILITGVIGSTRVAQVWRNTGSGFVNINAGLTGVNVGAVAWGDYNNDGRPDILLSGLSQSSGLVTEVWRNTGTNFVNIHAGLPGIIQGAVAWGDYDHDGRLDILLAGLDQNSVRIAQIWHNNGDGTFSNVTSTLAPGLPGVELASVAWGDYDNDGRLDFLIGGQTATGDILQVWRNTGHGFTNINAGLPGIEFGSAAWGDFDNDGRLDILLTGTNATASIAQVWRNTGSGFTNLNVALPGVSRSSAVWADFNGDGRIDFAYLGTTNLSPSGLVGQVWQNLWPTPDTAPKAPAGLTLDSAYPGVRLSWNPASDKETPTNGLTYNLRVGTAPGGGDVVGPMADTNGTRRVAQFGNARNNTNAFLSLAPGTYYWSVQSVDSAFTGSPFSSEGTFAVPALPFLSTLPATEVTPLRATLNASVNPDTLPTEYFFEFGPDTNYGSYSLTNSLPAGSSDVPVSQTVSNLPPGTYHFRVAASNSAGIVFGNDLTFSVPELGALLAGLPGLNGAAAAWGDYDNDGRLDLVLAGSTTTNDSGAMSQVWRNTGNGFTNIAAGLPGLVDGSVAWGDYNNDGRLDLAIAGLDSTGTPHTEIWRNTGNGFTNIQAGLPGISFGTVAWGDYDRDGRLDLLITGTGANGPITELWHNTGTGFDLVPTDLPAVAYSAAAWGDYDGDGRLDIAIIGTTNIYVSAPIAQIWRNTGTGFTNIHAGLPAVYFGAVAWGDYDGDGRLDLAVCGFAGANDISEVWRNTGSGFTNLQAGLPGLDSGSVAWGDYNGDGRPDLLLSGEDYAGNPVTALWLNSGTGFTNSGFNLPGVYGGTGVWGDFDHDGRLEFLLAGSASSGPVADIWKSTITPSNAPPTAPFSLVSLAQPPYTLLRWNRGSDPETPAAGLSYNLRVGSTPGASDILGPESDPTGRRRLPALGNAQSATNAALLLTAGTYYWSVQSVDAGFAGSPFSAEGSFSTTPSPIAFTLPATAISAIGAALNASINPDTLATSYYFEYGTTTNYGSVTATNLLSPGTAPVSVNQAVADLMPTTAYHFRVVAANGAGTATGIDQTFVTRAVTDLGLGIRNGSVAWGDYDRDGRLDVLIAGESGPNNSPVTAVLHNTGIGFTSANAGLPGISGTAAWCDFNHDGWLDIVLVGSTWTNGFSPTPLIQVWLNAHPGFTNLNAAFPNFDYTSVACGDYDSDGLPDLLLTGSTNGLVAGRLTEIWRNTGHGFTNINAGLPGVFDGSAVWIDANNDGRPDVLLTGQTGSPNAFGDFSNICELWLNTGTGFVRDAADGLSNAAGLHLAVADYDDDGLPDFAIAGETNSGGIFGQFGSVCEVWHNTGNGFTNLQAGLPRIVGTPMWGDFDNDGRPDLLLTGATNAVAATAIAEIWRNTGNGFTNLHADLPAFSTGAAAWGDFNNDGRLDVLLAGYDSSNLIERAVVWPNLTPVPNTAPSAPDNLSATSPGGILRLSWSPATDAQTPSPGLSYNLRVGTTPGGVDVVSPEAETNGFRLLPAPGNAWMRTNAFLNNLVPGTTYYWSVQAVDTAFAGGPFAPEASFVMPVPTLSITRTNTDVILSWPPAYAGVVLQESSRLNPAGWTNSPSGATNPIVVPITNETRFYRLFKP